MNISLLEGTISFGVSLENATSTVVRRLHDHFKYFLVDTPCSNGVRIIIDSTLDSTRKDVSALPIVAENSRMLHFYYEHCLEGCIGLADSARSGIIRCSSSYEDIFTAIQFYGQLQVILSGGIPLHASAIERMGQGVIFFGNHGDGKSTIARLSRNELVADDTALIFEKNGIYHISTTPFDLKFIPQKQQVAPIAACIRVSHTRQNDSLFHMKPGQIIPQLLEQVRPELVLFMNSPTITKKVFSSVVTFSQRVDIFYKLDFSLSRSYLRLLPIQNDLQHT